MKQLKKKMVMTILLSMIIFVPMRNFAVSKNTIKLYNVLGHSVGTLLKGIIQGQVKSFKSAGKVFLWGSVAGYGFYKSKTMIGNGNVTAGVVLANLSASVTENVTRGDNPFSYLGYTLGPVRFRFATPLSGKNRTLLNVDISPMDIYTFVWSLKQSNNISFRNGLLSFQADKAPDLFSDWTIRGWTIGMYPTIVKNKPEHIFFHESIHVIQYLQEMSISSKIFSKVVTKDNDFKKLLRVTFLNINYVDILNGFTINSNSDNPDRTSWKEAEAYTLATEAR